jgi:pilus assembly protein CpaD
MRFEKPLAVLLALSAAACATPQMVKDGKAVASSADLHEITVAQTGARLEVPVGPGGAMTPDAAAKINEFGATYRAVGHGPLIVSTPSGSGDSDSAARMAQATRMALSEGGVTFAAIAGSTYDAAGRNTAPIVLSFSRYEATAPDCAPVWTVNLADASSNNPTSIFGCSMNANLAAMIADPADLLGPRTTDPRDAARRDVVMDKYRNGEPTGATRSQDEKVVISTSVQ